MTGLPGLPAYAESAIHQFLRAHAPAGVVVGLSGGIDSAVAARLAVDALGADRVVALLLPDRAHPAPLLGETQAFARDLGIAARLYPIDPVEEAFRGLLPELEGPTAWGNVKARIRMILLYAAARADGRLVLGTGNKSELLLGYFTKWGDGGVDLQPLGDLYKTQVSALAERLQLPAAVRERPPSAGLWPGQTDEEELGAPYAALDAVLFGLEQLLPLPEIVRRTGLPAPLVEAVHARVVANRHKRRLPPIPKLALRTVGVDWRE